MGNLIPFSKKKDEMIQTVNISEIFITNQRKITAELHVLPEEIHILLRLLIRERKNIRKYYHQAYLRRDKYEMEYWQTIEDTINRLILQLKSIQSIDIDKFIKTISFMELDCLVGIMEEFLQDKYLLDLQLIEDDTPIITKQVEKIYKQILPYYEEKRKEYDETLEH